MPMLDFKPPPRPIQEDYSTELRAIDATIERLRRPIYVERMLMSEIARTMESHRRFVDGMNFGWFRD